MPELGFSTYVFVERIAANAAALHPFPEHNIALVRDALADYDREVSEYYDLRSGSRLESFTHLVGTTIGVGGAHVSPILEVLHEQGLCLR